MSIDEVFSRAGEHTPKPLPTARPELERLRENGEAILHQFNRNIAALELWLASERDALAGPHTFFRHPACEPIGYPDLDGIAEFLDRDELRQYMAAVRSIYDLKAAMEQMTAARMADMHTVGEVRPLIALRLRHERLGLVEKLLSRQWDLRNVFRALVDRVESAISKQIQTTNQCEEDIVQALQKWGDLKGEKLAAKAGYGYDGHFKGTLSSMHKRGTICNTRGRGYHLPESQD